MLFKQASVATLASMLAVAATLVFGILFDGARAGESSVIAFMVKPRSDNLPLPSLLTATFSTRGRNEICHGDQGAKTEDLRCCTKSKWCYLSGFIEDSQERFFFEADDDGERMTRELISSTGRGALMIAC